MSKNSQPHTNLTRDFCQSYCCPSPEMQPVHINWIPRTSCTTSQKLTQSIWVQRSQSPHWLRQQLDDRLLSSPYITLLVNYAVTEDANRAMGLFGLVLCLLSLHGGSNDWSAQVTCVRWAELNQVGEWSDSTLLDASQLERRGETAE